MLTAQGFEHHFRLPAGSTALHRPHVSSATSDPFPGSSRAGAVRAAPGSLILPFRLRSPDLLRRPLWSLPATTRFLTGECLRPAVAGLLKRTKDAGSSLVDVVAELVETAHPPDDEYTHDTYFVAAILGCSEQNVRCAVKRGALRARKIDGQWRFHTFDLCVYDAPPKRAARIRQKVVARLRDAGFSHLIPDLPPVEVIPELVEGLDRYEAEQALIPPQTGILIPEMDESQWYVNPPGEGPTDGTAHTLRLADSN